MTRRLGDQLEALALETKVTEGLNLLTFRNLVLRISSEIKLASNQGATPEQWRDSQAMCVVEEAGEFIGEYRRVKGFARRAGDREHMMEELADVVISAMIMFNVLGENAEAYIQAKLLKIISRGYVNKDAE